MLDEVPKREPLLIGERFRMSAGGVHSCLVRGREVTRKTYFCTSAGTPPVLGWLPHNLIPIRRSFVLCYPEPFTGFFKCFSG